MMSERSDKPLVLLDLFCGGGGACWGYQQAGWEVVGVDHKPRPNYPGKFIQADAVEYLQACAAEYDAIHASPPCQAYSHGVKSRNSKWVRHKGKDESMMIGVVRSILQETARPWIIENVRGSRTELNACLLLCGSMFGLPIKRHRLFESSFMLMAPHHPECQGLAKHYAAQRGWDHRDMTVTGKGRKSGTLERWKEIMGIVHPISQSEIVNSIPPAFTEWIGKQVLSVASRKPA
jgi:site-specific DNA-cytosine methylase